MPLTSQDSKLEEIFEKVCITPEVTIITPVYNGEKYIEDAVKSVLNQTYSQYEWIIINDSSSDNTNAMLYKVEQMDDRIKVIKFDKNRGPIHARNAGLSIAAGRYIAFLDIDDIWSEEKLEHQLSFMKETGTGLSYTGYRKFSKRENIDGGKSIPIPAKITLHSMKRTCSIMASSAMYDTAQTGRLLQDLTATKKDDLHLWLRILSILEEGRGLQKELCFLRIHKDSFTGNKLKEARKQWFFYRQTMRYPLLPSLVYFVNYAIAGTIKYLR